MADDTLFNFWYDIPMDKVNQPVPIDYHSQTFWSEEYGLRFLVLLDGKYANDSRVQNSWKEYESRVRIESYHISIKKLQLFAKGSNLTAAEHILNFTGKACSDLLNSSLFRSTLPYSACTSRRPTWNIFQILSKFLLNRE